MCLSPGEPPGHRGHRQARPSTQAIWSYRVLSFIYKRVTESPPPQAWSPHLCPQEGERPGPIPLPNYEAGAQVHLPCRGHRNRGEGLQVTAGAPSSSKWPVLRASARERMAAVLTRLGYRLGPWWAGPGW